MKKETEEKPAPPTETKRMLIPVAKICRDESNRLIDERDETFLALRDSIAIFGVLQPVHVRLLADETYELVDGERRWRAAMKLGLDAIPADVWPKDAPIERTTMAGFAMNEQRQAHSPIHMARRLRQIKRTLGVSHADLAREVGLPLDRVKTYFALLDDASEELIKFLEDSDVPAHVAAEFVRYQKATNEGAVRRLIKEYQQAPLTCAEIAALRKREQKRAARSESSDETPAPSETMPRWVAQLERAFDRNREDAARCLEALVGRLGYRLVAAESEKTRAV